jgi:hypothetical protein
MADRYVKLGCQDGSFTDPHSLFHIAGNEEKPLPKPYSPVVMLWLNSGGLLFCDPPGESPTEESVVEAEEPSKAKESETAKRKPGRPKGTTKR